MKINWKVRVKNPVFWINLAAAIVLPVLTYLGLNWSDTVSYTHLVTVINTVYADYITNDSVTSIVNDLYSRIEQTSEEILSTAVSYTHLVLDNGEYIASRDAGDRPASSLAFKIFLVDGEYVIHEICIYRVNK